jgi:hypothetical protein
MTPRLSKTERGERLRYVIGRSHVNGYQAARSRTLDVLGEIIEENDTLGGYTDRLHDMIIGGRVGFS